MRPLSDADIVRVWERGCRATRTRRAMALIAAASDDTDDGELASLTPGERDARLLSIRSTTFGRALDCVASCPSCGEQLEFVIETTALLSDPNYSATRNPTTLTTGDYRVTVRPPTIGDVEALSHTSGESLLGRCVVHHEARDAREFCRAARQWACASARGQVASGEMPRRLGARAWQLA